MEMDFDSLAVFDHVIIRHDEPISANDKATAGAKGWLAVRSGRVVWGREASLSLVYTQADHGGKKTVRASPVPY